jgi:hypothetical protein
VKRARGQARVGAATATAAQALSIERMIGISIETDIVTIAPKLDLLLRRLVAPVAQALQLAGAEHISAMAAVAMPAIASVIDLVTKTPSTAS